MLPLPSSGLCAAALLARSGKRVTVLESHYHPGGAAHAFEASGYSFDAGPSFYAGLAGEHPGEGQHRQRRCTEWQARRACCGARRGAARATGAACLCLPRRPARHEH